MSLLEDLPHRCTIFLPSRGIDSSGGSTYSVQVVATDIPCWEQVASASETTKYQKRGISVSTKVFFVSNPNLTERHRILITERRGVAAANLNIHDVSNPDVLTVTSVTEPDASAGLGILWRVMCDASSGNTQ